MQFKDDLKKTGTTAKIKHFDQFDCIEVAILSDTHGYLDPKIAKIVSECDIAIHAGDICGGHILDEMQPKLAEVITVRGNNDLPFLWDLSEADVIAKIPDYASIRLPSGDVVIEHGHRYGGRPDHQLLRNDYPNAKIIVYGHSHKMCCDQSENTWVINPGAAGRQRTYGGASCFRLKAYQHKPWEIKSYQVQS